MTSYALAGPPSAMLNQAELSMLNRLLRHRPRRSGPGLHVRDPGPAGGRGAHVPPTPALLPFAF